MDEILKRRIKTNIRQARTKYKIRAVGILFKIILRGEFTFKGSYKFWKKVLLGSPRYTVDKCVTNCV